MRRVLDAFFSPHAFRQSLPDVWAGFQLNIKLMVVAEILVLALALGIAIVRGLPGRPAGPLRALAVVYTDFFRGTPLRSSIPPTSRRCTGRESNPCTAASGWLRGRSD